ncbi:MAG: ArsR family transcriptional regulator [Candidatus Thorarchaeota archaeon]
MTDTEKLEVKYKERHEDAGILEKVNEIYEIETRHAIIMAIDNFGSANIKKLAKILGKNEATIYYHLKELTKKPEFLKIDQEMTNSHKGIFYELTDLAKKHFSEVKPEVFENVFTKLFDKLSGMTDEEIATFYLDLLKNHPEKEKITLRDRKRVSYNHILENFMLTNLDRNAKALIDGKTPISKRYPIGSLSISSIDMKVSTPKHLFQILKIISEAFAILAHLQEKITQEMNDQKIPEEERIDVHYHIMGGEIAEFGFE